MKTITELCNEVFVDICYYIEECQLSITLEKFEKIAKYAELAEDIIEMAKIHREQFEDAEFMNECFSLKNPYNVNIQDWLNKIAQFNFVATELRNIGIITLNKIEEFEKQPIEPIPIEIKSESLNDKNHEEWNRIKNKMKY